MSVFPLVAAAILYLAATLYLSLYLRNLSLRCLRFGRFFLLAGFIFHILCVVFYFFEAGHFIPTTPSEGHLYFTLLLSIGCLALNFRRSLFFVVIVILPLISLALFLFHTGEPAAVSEVVSLPTPSPWLRTHILLTIVGEAFFVLGAAISVVYLIAERQLKRREFSGLIARIPSLPSFDRFLSEILSAGFVLLTLGLVFGIIFAKSHWRVDWLKDPKVIFCVLIWVLYAGILSLRKFSPFYRGHRTAVIAVVGFFSVLFLSWGMDYFVSSSHPRLMIIEQNNTQKSPP